MKRRTSILAIAACLGMYGGPCARAGEQSATLTPLYQFPGLSDGEIPWGALASLGGTYYGTTFQGGAYGRGTIFSINPASGAEQVLYSFEAGTDGINPQAGLLAVGKLLYGVSNNGGTNGYGTVYSFDPATNKEQTLFNLTPAMGGGSGSNLVYAAGTLYGTSFGGGTGAGYGAVFKVDIKTGAGSLLYAFTGGADGGSPQTGIAYAAGVIYGTTVSGGSGGGGTLFAVNAQTGADMTLFSFDYGADGGFPVGGIIDVKGTLYGTNEYGGTKGDGTVFSYSLSTGKERNIYEFAGGTDGANPQGTLLEKNGVLYGTAYGGGANGYGTVFSINAVKGTETTYYAFTGGADGGHSVTPLIYSAGALLGTATGENLPPGIHDGSVFKIALPSGTETTLHSFEGGANEPGNTLPVDLGGTLYGTTGATGANLYGTIYKIDPATGAQTTLYSFTGGADGGGPGTALVVVGGSLYGTTIAGGANQTGTIFTLNPKTGALTTLSSFPVGVSRPGTAMAAIGGILYGTTASGGTSGAGSVFRFSIGKKTYSTLYNFTGGNDGGTPYAGLTTDGKTLYGSTYLGGTASSGTVFSMSPANGAETVLYNFTGGSDGRYPTTAPIASGGTLFGSAAYGGNEDADCFGGFGCGVLYAITLQTDAFAVLHSFSFYGDGAVPGNLLVTSGGVLYGVTGSGGAAENVGTVFSYDPSQSAFATIYTFTGGDDGGFPVGLLQSGTTLYGATAGAGAYGLGNVFSLTGY